MWSSTTSIPNVYPNLIDIYCCINFVYNYYFARSSGEVIFLSMMILYHNLGGKINKKDNEPPDTMSLCSLGVAVSGLSD